MNATRLVRLAFTAGLFLLILAGGRPLILGCGLIGGILLLLLLFPGSGFSRVMFSQHGPSLDAGIMSRGECLRSARGFLVIGAMCLGSIYLIEAVASHFGVDPWNLPELEVLVFMYAIFLGMSVLGAGYLVLRAPFRPTVMPATEGPDHADA
jgi:hypothetical protein